MDWNHLPMPGGLYAQSPELIDRLYYIMAEKASFDEQERAKRDAENKPKGRRFGRRRS